MYVFYYVLILHLYYVYTCRITHCVTNTGLQTATKNLSSATKKKIVDGGSGT